jgi:PPOX class probable F420-dependent enzyme
VRAWRQPDDRLLVMHVMSEEEWKAFLTAEPPHTGKLATVRKDGRPHVAPIWFDLDDDGSIVFTTGSETLKGKSIRRDPRVCLCVDDERPPFSFVVVDGKVDISEDLDELLIWATRIGGRYMGAANAEAYGRRNAVPGELLVRLRPTHVVARAAIAD